MSTQVSLLQQNVPAHIAKRLEEKGVRSFLTTGSQREFASLSFSGKAFTFINVAGEKVEHDKRTLDVIIVDGLPTVSRRYYAGRYDPNKVAAPTCYATNGRTPDDEVQSPQARSCNACPQNEKGSNAAGDGKACGFLRVMVVMLFGDPDRTLYRMTVPAMGMFAKGEVPGYMNLVEYDKHLRENGASPETVITRISFAPKQSVPVPGFKPMGYVDEEDIEAIEALEPGQLAPMLKIVTSDEKAGGPAPKKAAPADDEDDAPVARKPKAAAVQDEDDAPVARKPKAAAVQDEDDAPVARVNKATAASVKAPRTIVVDEDADAILAQLTGD